MTLPKIRVLIADNHLLIREGIQKILLDLPSIEVIGEASDSDELASKISILKPNLVIIDCFMSGAFKPEDLEIIKKQELSCRILVVTSNEEKTGILKVLSYGVNHFILKQCGKEEFINAVNATTRDDKFFCSKVIDVLLEKRFPQDVHCEPSTLSRREIEVINHIALGMTNSAIAEKIHLSIHTVSTHRRNILRKLNLRNSSELVMYGIRMGIIQTEQH